MTQDQAAEFESWWALVWRKVDKGHARRSYLKARKLVSHERLCAAAEAFKERLVSKGTEIQFQPYPATWLNGERWLDEEHAEATGGIKITNEQQSFNRVELALRGMRSASLSRADVMLALRAGKIDSEQARRLGL